MPRQVFVAGEILTAANMNDLSDQSVMVFDDASARTTAIPTPVEGMVTYLKDTDAVEKYDGSNFVGVATAPAILQVVSVTLTDVFTTASTSYTEVTDLNVSITPSSASSKILVQARLALSNSGTGAARGQVLRDSTAIGGGVAASPRPSGAFFSRGANTVNNTPTAFIHLDSPSSTSSLTYKIEVATDSGLACVNRSQGGDFSGAGFPRMASTITVMEVAG